MLQKTPLAELLTDPEQAASAAGLRYITDSEPGITRRKAGLGWVYLAPDGSRVRDKRTLFRIRSLAIPPAWTKVWISPDPNGHLAATGFDVKGRKQYRYNADFVAVRDAAKFDHILAFALALPSLRKRVRRDMALHGLPRRKVLATIVYLLERTLSRVGNENYAKDNKSFGLTTLRNHHVKVRGGELRFIFTGKSGKTWRLAIESRRVAKVVRACQDLPGQNLFEYRDEDGKVQRIGSSDVNAYLQEITGETITAKDFRTWFGTVETAVALETLHRPGDKPTKKILKAAIERTAEKLRNTVSVCRKNYVHPAIAEAYLAGEFVLPAPRHSHGLKPEEERVLAFLKQRLQKPRRHANLSEQLQRSLKRTTARRARTAL